MCTCGCREQWRIRTIMRSNPLINLLFLSWLSLVLKAEITNVTVPTSYLHDSFGAQSPACLMEDLEHTSDLLSTQYSTVNWLDLEKEINHILSKSYPKRLLCLQSNVLFPIMQNSPGLSWHVKVLRWEQQRLLIQRWMRITIWSIHIIFLFICFF